MKYIIYTCLLLGWSACLAQPPIEGTVSGPGGEGIEGVSVTLQTRSTGMSLSSTNAKGEYKVEGLQPGSYRMLFEREGFTPLTRAVTLNYDDDSGDVDVTLTPQAASPAQPRRRLLIRIFSRFAGFFRSSAATSEARSS